MGNDFVSAPKVDKVRIQNAVKEIILAIGEDSSRVGLVDTPRRVAESFCEIFGGVSETFSGVCLDSFEVSQKQLISVKNVPIYSMCEHHFLPFHGFANIVYLPNDKGSIVGLSNLFELVKIYMRRLQLQERLTQNIVDALVRCVEPAGVLVVMECKHLCVSMRDVNFSDPRCVTSVAYGRLAETGLRAEAMSVLSQN